MTWELVSQITALGWVSWFLIVSFMYIVAPIMPKTTGCYVDLKGEVHHVTSVD